MKRAFSATAVVVSALLALGAIAAAGVAITSERSARGAFEDALRLRDLQVDTARAERRLGDSKLDEALDNAHAANAAARRVKRVTAQIVELLKPTVSDTRTIAGSGKESLETAQLSRVRTALVAQLLGELAGYQNTATEASAPTNDALRRILRALQEINDSFPGALPARYLR